MAASGAFAPWAARMRQRLRARNIVCNDAIFGFHDTGAMTEPLVLRLLEGLVADRVAEFYFHPATRKTDALTRNMPTYRNVEEFNALRSERVIAALKRLDIRPVAFRDL
jgi:hypothetical protein